MNNRDDSLSLISKYRNQIMGLATIWILFFHEWTIGDPDTLSLIGKVFKNILRFGYCGVDIFFLLSGMSLTYAIVKESTIEFYIKRFKRIILPALLMAILQALEYRLSFIEMLKNLFGYNMLFRSLYSFLWFVPAIMLFYLFFPIYYKLFSKSKSKLLFTTTSLLIWLTLAICFSGIIRTDLYSVIDRMPIFLIGVYIGYAQQNKNICLTKEAWLFFIVMFVSGLALAFLTCYHDYYLIVPISNCFIPSMFIGISVSFLSAKFLDIIKNIKISTYLNKILLFFGAISYELYCIQEGFGSYITNYIYTHFICSQLALNVILIIVLPIIAYILMLIFKYFWKLVSVFFSHKQDRQVS